MTFTTKTQIEENCTYIASEKGNNERFNKCFVAIKGKFTEIHGTDSFAIHKNGPYYIVDESGDFTLYRLKQ